MVIWKAIDESIRFLLRPGMKQTFPGNLRKVNINDNLIFIVIKLMSALVFIVGFIFEVKVCC